MNFSGTFFIKSQSPSMDMGMMGLKEQFIDHPPYYFSNSFTFHSDFMVICCKINRIEGEWNGRRN